MATDSISGVINLMQREYNIDRNLWLSIITQHSALIERNKIIMQGLSCYQASSKIQTTWPQLRLSLVLYFACSPRKWVITIYYV